MAVRVGPVKLVAVAVAVARVGLADHLRILPLVLRLALAAVAVVPEHLALAAAVVRSAHLGNLGI